MPNSIEILQNTLLKLIVRQGSDSDRQNILLDAGELGYTTDGKRLFVGDGSEKGGSVVGNKYLGEGNPVSFSDAQVGDLAFYNGFLYKFNGVDYINPANWRVVGSVYTAGNSIEIDSNTLKLSGGGISTNRVSTYDSEYLSLPAKTSLNSVNYNWPGGGLQNDYFLSTDIFGNLSWNTPVALNTFYVSNSASRIPVGMIAPFLSGGNVPYGWLLCNGDSVAGSTYPDLSAAIGTTYGGSGGNFNVPNFNNKTLYGTAVNPFNSTTYRLISGTTNVGISAVGVNFIIKAIADNLVSSTLTVANTLSGTLNGATITGSPVSTLSGNISIGLAPVGTAGTIQAPFNVDAYGRVTGVPTTAAGIIENLSGTEVVNPSSYIKYLKRPIQVLSIASNTYTTATITVSPTIFPTVGSASATLPANAKTVLLESTLRMDNNNQTGLVCSALNAGLLHTPTNSLVTGSNEYLINKASSKVYGGSTSTTQCMVPLSSNGSTLSFAVRVSVGNLDVENGTLRIIGYTL
jgi:microcystin-dependent protein